ncbi:hypothetical protein COCC4DRAFT_147553 [Bipolaris maydis ATCC 48331]|uniref:Uncharacterized protein n=2 Tax=Cochliobolus heterostrophus TaxID=5016 RepID=M2V3P7_COCH5|nr:uncharacterized protein COCC4DRAFT_147553 [Bipolaris maydis ATCC 48331]EMD94648.1 hypothetical protein COCHEDRAFT_1152525 [Bipolaris maydis C5]ENI01640.1 hypothetical protein COCC4DRAFT_147553 [Bipolaris maydis ATCC 48331]
MLCAMPIRAFAFSIASHHAFQPNPSINTSTPCTLASNITSINRYSASLGQTTHLMRFSHY